MTDARTIHDPEALLAREAALRAGGARLRMRDAAAALGTPEAALIEARRTSGAALRLKSADPAGFAALIERLPEAGEVMALTRNDSCVHEKHGRFTAPEFHGAMGQVVGEIDLRLFLQHWRFAYALTEDTAAGPRRSLQFFDGAGGAIHKIYRTQATDAAAFDRIVAGLADPDAQSAAFVAPEATPPDRPDGEIDAAGLRAGWATLEHSHAFFGLLRRFGAGRQQALRLGGPEFARQLAPSAARRVLEAAAAAGLPVMIFVGNPGCMQIHSGPVARIEVMGPWLNVLDPRFNLHLREDRIAGAWVVRKPSVRGDVHSLELYDASGGCFCQVFGDRPPGAIERTDWRALVNGLPSA